MIALKFMRPVLLLCVIALACGPSDLAAQAPQYDALARAYSALASGRFTEAEAIARRLLEIDGKDHGAAAVAIHAAVSRDVDAALMVYEHWLGAAQHEDAYLLEPVARAVIAALAEGPAGELRDRAIAISRPNPDAPPPLPGNDEVRGRALLAELGTGGRARTLVLRELGQLQYAPAAPDVLALLADSSPDVRAAAAEALGRLGQAEAVPALLRALKDRATEVRVAAAIALHQLGDPGGDTVLRQMLQSGASDLQLQAAQAMADAPPDQWVQYVEPLLHADAPMTRLAAARLLLDVHPRRAEATIASLLSHQNPVIAAETAVTLADGGIADLPTIRRMLGAALPTVRLEGAIALLRLLGRTLTLPDRRQAPSWRR